MRKFVLKATALGCLAINLVAGPTLSGVVWAGTTEKQITTDQILATAKQDVVNELDNALDAFKSAVQEVKRESGVKAFVPFPKKVFPDGTPVAEVLRVNGLKVVFSPPELEQRLVVVGEQVFSTLADLAIYLEQTYKVFTRFNHGLVTISLYDRRTYSVDFAQGYLNQRTLQALLHGDLAYANYFPETGKLVVYDDYEGQEAVRKYLNDLAKRIRRVYYYTVEVTDTKTKKTYLYKGEVVAGRSAPLGDLGFIRVFPGDKRAMVYVNFPQKPTQTYSFLVNRRGGEWTAENNNLKFQVSILLKGTIKCTSYKVEEF